MIEVDNFDKIRPMLNFDKKFVYLVWLVKRNKDGNTKAKGNNKNRTIKSYFFQDIDHFDSRKEEIIALCKLFNCRAYICVNRKPVFNVLLEMSNNINERLRQVVNDNFTGFNGIVDSAIMKTGSDGNKLWVVDVDTKDEKYIDEIKQIVNSSRSGFSPVVVDEVPTAHGLHLITHPFDLSNLTLEPEIKKEGLTLLYAYLNE